MEGMEGMEAVAHNPPALKQQRDRAQKRGFSLIEAAFVLAVVGVVIGSIWYAAAKFYEDYKVSKTVEEIFSTARNIQNLISIRDAEMIGDGVNITATLLSAGSYPKNWIQGNNVKSLFGVVNTRNKISPAPPRFDTYFSLNNSSCILLDLLRK